jgi:acetyl esterase
MPLDPQAKALLDQIRAMGAPELHTLSVADARQALVNLAAMQGPPQPIARVEDRTIPAPAGAIPVRIYTPEARGPLPLLVYFHGGGWVLGSLDTTDGICRALANGAGCVVVSVDYRLAPEHRFPAAADDALHATQWAAAYATSIGGDPKRIAIAGDSAGGNLTAVVAQMARDRGKPALAFQLLIYPVTDANFETRSYRDNGTDYLLTRDAMQWFWNHYVPTPADRTNPYAAPLRASSLAGLPPALVITAEFDPLRDEGEAYAACMRDAGVPVTLTRYHGMVHGFFGMAAVLDQARRAIDDSCAALRAAFGGAASPA